ncbi:MAG: glycosyltransferase [Cyanobacteria bacterium P01_F01_bin.150]
MRNRINDGMGATCPYHLPKVDTRFSQLKIFRKMQKALIIGPNTDNIVKAQKEPFFYNKKEISKRLNLTVQYINAETATEIEQASVNTKADILFLMFQWKETPGVVESTLINIRNSYLGSKRPKIIFIDPFAQSSTRFFNILPYVDFFLKRQCLRDIDQYKEDFIGGSTMTDFIAKTWSYDFDGWHVGSCVPDEHKNRVIPGWNLGTAKKYKKLLTYPKIFRFRQKKNIDIFCRLSLGYKKNREWYCEYRIASVKALEPLKNLYKLATSALFLEDGLISKKQYLSEMKRSRIVFSPFGWGENCWRDFEAICYDCLLIKPDMSHLKTNPNIFIPGETYVPIKWDFSDLEEKCTYYLEHQNEANRIIKNARFQYRKYFTDCDFVNLIGQLIS